MPDWRAEPGGDQQRAELVAVQSDGMRLVVHPRPPYMSSRGMIQEFFLDGIPVEPSDRAQAAGDGGPGPSAGFQVPGEALDVGRGGRRTRAGTGRGTRW